MILYFSAIVWVLTSLSSLPALDEARELSNELRRYPRLSTVPSELRLLRRDEVADCVGDDVALALYIALTRRGCGGARWFDGSVAVGMTPAERDGGKPGVKARGKPFWGAGV